MALIDTALVFPWQQYFYLFCLFGSITSLTALLSIHLKIDDQSICSARYLKSIPRIQLTLLLVFSICMTMYALASCAVARRVQMFKLYIALCSGFVLFTLGNCLLQTITMIFYSQRLPLIVSIWLALFVFFCCFSVNYFSSLPREIVGLYTGTLIILVGWFIAQFESRTIFFTLVGLCTYDCFAVFCPYGPLNLLARGSMPAFSFHQAEEVVDYCAGAWQDIGNIPLLESREEVPLALTDDDKFGFETQPNETFSDHVLSRDMSLVIGVGDIIWYSALSAKAATGGPVIFVECFFGLLLGLVITITLCCWLDRRLPALPMPIILGSIWTLCLLLCLILCTISLNVLASISDILTVGNQALNTSCSEVAISDIIENSEPLALAARHLHDTLHEFRAASGFGRAIAAPQLGYPLRMIAAHLKGVNRTIYNPIITYKSSELFTMWDDCLSFPDLMVAVRRHKHISMSFTNELGQVEEWIEMDQPTSELLQHEIDHLDGILAVDIAVPLVDGVGNIVSSSIVSRSVWLDERSRFEAMVDYTISPPEPKEPHVRNNCDVDGDIRCCL